VEGVIGERIRRLDGPLRDILHMASVSGELFSAEVVAAALSLNGRHVQSQLSRELDKKHQLVRALDVRQEDGVRLSRYRFRHILIQRYLYDSLDEIERVYQHEALGNALERLYGENTSAVSVELARHFETAVVPHKAQYYLEQAGDKARQAIALDQARDYYRAALGYLENDDIEARAKLLQKLAETLWILSQVPEARQLFEEALVLRMRLEDGEGMGAIHRRLGRMYWELHDREEALFHYHQSLKLLEEFPESVELAWALSSISQMHMLASEYEEAIRWGKRALALAEKLGADVVKVHALNNLGASYKEGDQAQGVALLYESVRLAKELGLPYDVGRAYHNLSTILRYQNRLEEFAAVVEEAYAYAQQTQTDIFLLGAAISRMSLSWQRGKWRLALAQLDELKIMLAEREAVALNPIRVGTFAASANNDCGLPQNALAELRAIEPLVMGLNEPHLLLEFYRQVVRAHILLENVDNVLETIETMVVIGKRPQVNIVTGTWYLTALDWFVTREDSYSLQQAKQMLAIIESLDAESSISYANYLEGVGLIALREQDGVQAAEALAQVVTVRQAEQDTYGLMRAQFNYGRALVQTGQEEKAQAAFAEAARMAAALADELDDPERKSAFWQTPLLQAVRQNSPRVKSI
jgi:tetratricopeptide (TPR) repeat protein